MPHHACPRLACPRLACPRLARLRHADSPHAFLLGLCCRAPGTEGLSQEEAHKVYFVSPTGQYCDGKEQVACVLGAGLQVCMGVGDRRHWVHKSGLGSWHVLRTRSSEPRLPMVLSLANLIAYKLKCWHVYLIYATRLAHAPTLTIFFAGFKSAAPFRPHLHSPPSLGCPRVSCTPLCPHTAAASAGEQWRPGAECSSRPGEGAVKATGRDSDKG